MVGRDSNELHDPFFFFTSLRSFFFSSKKSARKLYRTLRRLDTPYFASSSSLSIPRRKFLSTYLGSLVASTPHRRGQVVKLVYTIVRSRSRSRSMYMKMNDGFDIYILYVVCRVIQ